MWLHYTISKVLFLKKKKKKKKTFYFKNELLVPHPQIYHIWNNFFSALFCLTKQLYASNMNTGKALSQISALF